MTAHDRNITALVAVVCSITSFIPCFVGLGLGMGAFDRRMKTPGIAWFGVISNGIMLLIWIGLSIFGAIKGT